MTTALLTVTHDEPTTLPTMLESVRDVVDGPTLAFHVGENEETMEILHEHGAEVERREWSDFDGTWGELFERAEGRADRLLYMGASHILKPRDEPCELDPKVPCYMVWYQRGNYDYRLENLLRGDIRWSISAPVHGIILPCFEQERQPLDTYTIYEDESNGRRPEKIARYLPICERMVAQNPKDARAVFYLARTYFDLGRFEEAVAMYERRITMGGWDEEVWHAHYMKGLAQIRMGEFGEGRLTLLAAYLRRPQRAEPLHAICKSMLPPDDLLFIETEVYGTP